METVVNEEEEEKLVFSSHLNFNLRNYVDRAMLQTMIDAKEQDEPLRILEKSLFKGDELEKIIDRIAVKESIIMSFLYKSKRQS